MCPRARRFDIPCTCSTFPAAFHWALKVNDNDRSLVVWSCILHSKYNTCMYTMQTCFLSPSLNTHSYKCTPESRGNKTMRPTHIQVHVHAHYSPVRVLERVDLTFLVHVALSPLLFTGLLRSTTTTGAWSSGAAFYTVSTIHACTQCKPVFFLPV